MNTLTTKRKNYWVVSICAIVIGGAGLFVYITGALDLIPRLHASAQSPSAAFSVLVYRKRLSLGPIFPRMGAMAEVYNKEGRLVYKQTIYQDDDWDNTLGNAYTQISFVGDEIHIAPNPYRSDSPYIISRSDLWNLQN